MRGTTRTNPARSLPGAYVARDPAAVGLLGGHFDGAEQWADAIRRARPLREAARRVLHEQNASGPQTEARDRNLAALDQPGTVAVVTGQQPGLFGGPLLAYLKAVAAVALAHRIEREHGVRCIPVFWVQSEDHDFEEVAEHVWLTASGALASARLEDDGCDRVSLAHRRLGGQVERCTAALEVDFASTPHGQEVANALRRHYVPGTGVADAFASFMGELLAEQGLLTFRPRTSPIAEAVAPLHARCIEEMDAIEALLRARIAEMAERGFSAPIPVREGAALSFFHPDGATGPRYRVVRRDGTLCLAGGGHTFAVEQLLTAARSDPLRFSTSALLRPIAQDSLLPTIAYIAGPTELAYFAQLPPLYDHFGTNMPLLVPRPSLRWLDASARALLGSLPVDDATLADDGPVARQLGSRTAGLDLEALASSLESALRRELGGAHPALAALDPGLGKACDKTLSTARQACEKLVRKATRAALQQAPAEQARLMQLRDMIRPRGAPQERVLGWTSLAARLGPDRLRDTALAFDPRQPGLREIDVD